MALKNFITAGSMLAALIVTQFETADAQIHIPGPRFEHRDIEQPDETMPMATPGVFDYDAQIFAPMEFVSDDQLEPRSGFFASYDRTYLSLTKAPRLSGAASNQIDLGSNFVWGSRYNFGWFSEDETGWGITYQHNRGNAYQNGQDILISNPMLVTNAFASVEINKIFRQEMSSGSTLEPYVGMRYFNVHDETLEDTDQSFVVGFLPADNRFKQEANNNMIGFHAGARHSRRSGRWRFTTDGAVTAAYNQQEYFATDILREITASGVILTSISETSVEDQSFVPALDVEFDIAFNVTRDITLKTGVQCMYLWTGINRANTLTTGLNPNSILSGGIGATDTNDTRFLAAGFIFGFEWRR
ncbi:BBP7 family outer membrane beta-barrel protein [Mariniblastus fucicola]|uniref:Uncharacterized protein n=1 Tax=Mariniblastus fucicola TaxID=980251 RepID=A0A5B9P778_9BACT|nr:BBP7 family outer membrane beta-barrel protein [Mariniblastus fucicola]QEG22174.1 hypothetical protein MFFC18_20350 [Mariniblastus fucicola]